jgi:predicted phage terminase large subunit-like protein
MNGALAELAKRNKGLETAALDKAAREAKEARLKKAENDFTYFCEYYLSDYFFCKPAEYQKILYEVIQNRELTEENANKLKKLVPDEFQSTFKARKNLRGIIDVEPRGHGKSTRMTFAFPLWQLLFKKSKFIIIIGASKDDAILQLENTRFALEENDNIIDDFGFLKGSTWNKQFLSLTNGTAIVARGKGGSLRGLRKRQNRPDLIIVDDTFKDNEADSSQIRDKVHKWFNKTIQPLGTEALIVIVNTITNEDDLPSRLLKDIKENRKNNWIGLRFSAEIKKGVPLWSERYTWKELKTLQNDLGSIAYAQEYLSKPLSDEDRIFKTSWIVRCQHSEIPTYLYRTEGIDPATGVHDMSAVVDAGYDKESGIIYIYSSHGQRESTESFKRRLIQRYKLYRYRKAYMEDVQFQTVYKKEIIKDAAKEGVALPIKGVHPGKGSKSIRLMSISPLVENGLVVFAPGNEDLIDQLTGFPTAGYDDLCDAFYYAIKAIQENNGKKLSDLRIFNKVNNRKNNIRRSLNI